jgi:hypothetical protein
LYGRQWEASYGHIDGEAFKDWSDALGDVPLAKIKNALDALVEDEQVEFPPNLIKFLRLCRTSSPPNSQMYKSLPPATPLNLNSPEVVAAKDKHFEAVRELLG